jgi:imidazolonepropionase-like amidohydrolase
VDEAFVRKNLKINSEHGLLYYRDGGDKYSVSEYAKTIAGEYGIDYVTPVYIIHKKDHYGFMFGRAFETMLEYRSLINDALTFGADFVKTTASGLLDFSRGGYITHPSLTFGELSEMINIAHGEGLAVMVHANGADNIKRAAEAGADSIEHGYYMDASALKIMADTDSIWVPTCVTSSTLIGTGLYNDKVLRDIVDGHKSALIEALMIGVSVACGSDAGASYVPQGSGTIDEMTILKSVGIDPALGNQKISERFRRR